MSQCKNTPVPQDLDALNLTITLVVSAFLVDSWYLFCSMQHKGTPVLLTCCIAVPMSYYLIVAGLRHSKTCTQKILDLKDGGI